MATLTAVVNLSLDGVMQAPGAPDEDPRGGFTAGGWASRLYDQVLGDFMGRRMSAGPGAMLFGRWTYEQFHGVWHGRDDGNPFTPVLDAATKYVASRTLTEPLVWENSVLLRGEAAETVAKLKAEEERPIVVLGCGTLMHTLVREDLVDEYVLPIHPLLLGKGLRLFPDDGPVTPLELVETLPTTTGVVITHYRRAATA